MNWATATKRVEQVSISLHKNQIQQGVQSRCHCTEIACKQWSIHYLCLADQILKISQTLQIINTLELGCGRHPLKSRKFNSQNEFKCLEPLYQANSSKFILGSSTKLIAISHNCTVYTFWSHIEKRCTETVNIYNNFFPLFVDC